MLPSPVVHRVTYRLSLSEVPTFRSTLAALNYRDENAEQANKQRKRSEYSPAPIIVIVKMSAHQRADS